MPRPAATRLLARRLTLLGLVPLVFYLTAFALYTFPAVLSFRTHYFCDSGDGFKYVWDLWWIGKALQSGQFPFFTRMMYWPTGVTLVADNLTPLNGLIALGLRGVGLTLVEAHNVLIIFGFGGSGLTAFWLAYRMSGHYLGALVAGFVFTFSSYHFAHAEGHLNLVSLQWLPLFIWFFYELLERPRVGWALAAAAILVLNGLTDFYLLFYCGLTAVVLTLWHARQRRNLFFAFQRPYRGPMAIFAVLAALTCGLQIAAILMANHRDPFEAGHPASEFGMDVLAPLIPGGHWRWANLTAFYWQHLKANIHESSVYLGWAALGLMIYAWRKRAAITDKNFGFWYVMFWIFAILALGPRLLFWGHSVASVLPYAVLQWIFPPLKLSGMPVRMFVLAILAASVAASFGVRAFSNRPARRWIVPLLLLLMIIEYQPRPLTLSPAAAPEWVYVLRQLPAGAAIDQVSPQTSALYYQTIHEKPLAFGYASREPESIRVRNEQIHRRLAQGDYAGLVQLDGFSYVITRDVLPPQVGLLLFESEGTRIYRFQPH